MNAQSDKLSSFNPLFGTNHKFNGWDGLFLCRESHQFCWVGGHQHAFKISEGKSNLTISATSVFFSLKYDGQSNAKNGQLFRNGNRCLVGLKIGANIDFHWVINTCSLQKPWNSLKVAIE